MKHPATLLPGTPSHHGERPNLQADRWAHTPYRRLGVIRLEIKARAAGTGKRLDELPADLKEGFAQASADLKEGGQQSPE